MENRIITFEANQQCLRKTGGPNVFATKTVSYVEAQFDLGENWTGFDSVSAVWWNDFVKPIPAVLDTEGICEVPHEVLTMKGEVYVNLVGSIAEGDVLTSRLTTAPITAFCNKFNAQLGEGTTTPLTPSEYEQFVASVKADADRAETAKDGARVYAGNALSSAQNALVSETNASTSEDNAKISELSASASAESASEDAERAENAKDAVLGMRAEATTLEPNESATASYSDGVLTLGIPKGVKGDRGQQGIQGETGATPNFTIGTVETLEPTEDATASITGTAEDPVLNLGIPKGEQGDVNLSQLEALLPTETASGEIVTITDGQSVVPAKSLKVALEPIQSGSGTPSPDNVRPISGRTEVVTSVSGVNVWDEVSESGYISIADGTDQSGGAYARSKNYSKCLPNTSYYFRSSASQETSAILWYDADKNYISGVGAKNETVTSPSNAYYFRIYYDVSTYNHDISINYPSTDHEYHAYEGTTYTTALGRTVYGGTLDVVSGELVVDKIAVEYDGTETNWTASGSYVGSFYALDSRIPSQDALVSCSHLTATKSVANYQYGSCLVDGGPYTQIINLYLFNEQTPEETFINYLKAQKANGTPITVVYELATPQTIQLTPQEVELLLGNNTIWSDGDVAIVYSADVTKWIEKQLS